MITSIQTALFILGLAIVPPQVQTLAPIIQGEAGGCTYAAMLDIASVYQNNDNMNGWKQPRGKALAAAYEVQYNDSLRNQAGFVFNARDIGKPAVKRIIERVNLLRVHKCNTSKLYVYSVP